MNMKINALIVIISMSLGGSLVASQTHIGSNDAITKDVTIEVEPSGTFIIKFGTKNADYELKLRTQDQRNYWCRLPLNEFSIKMFAMKGTNTFNTWKRFFGPNILFAVASQGNANVLTELLTIGFDINQLDSKDSRTALMKAAAANDSKAVKLLLALGANVNATNAKGETAEFLTSSKTIKNIIEANPEMQRPGHKEDFSSSKEKIMSRISLPEDIVSEVQEYLGY